MSFGLEVAIVLGLVGFIIWLMIYHNKQFEVLDKKYKKGKRK